MNTNTESSTYSLTNMASEAERIWDNLTLADNFIFQKVMKNQDLCKKIISEILNVEVTEISYPEMEKSIDIRRDSKSIRLDVYVKSADTIYNIEIQNSINDNIPKRGRYYQGLIDLDLLEKGEHYNKLNKSIVIFICTFDYYKLSHYKYTFTNKCHEIDGLEYGDETTKIIINTYGTKGDISDDLKEFLNCVNGVFSSSDFSVKLKGEFDKVKQSREWRREFMTQYLREMQLRIECEERGLQQGLQQGLEQGLQQGIETGRIEAIKNMLKKLSPDDIIELGYDRELVTAVVNGDK